MTHSHTLTTHIQSVIVKASSGPRYVVGCRNKVDKAKLTSGTRVALDMTTLTIMRALPREVRVCVGVSVSVCVCVCEVVGGAGRLWVCAVFMQQAYALWLVGATLLCVCVL